ncbi:outer membrane protein assembly factor [Gallaecimonas kandeliae]|uniref:autotransporter assembly complex protein TamA n=1 Tax=Gallaecimonas kandeliae TaxID=3029055 RepID=UPI002647E976|nr:outer membrane protein assembly factor [Gallaecimonas kandeliae]WKE64490.1 outer membrane protein assembly factor [Gallaecimonas kandeliae]
MRLFKLPALLGLLLCLALPAWAAAPKLQYRLQGLDGALADNAGIYLDQLPDIPPEKADLHFEDLETALRNALKPLGYYQPKIRFGELDGDSLPISVDPGEPVRYRHLDIQLEGDAKSDELFLELLKNLPFKAGAVLRHDQYESAKGRLQSLALQRGYFDARFTANKVEVHLEDNAADLSLHFDSGKRYRFGAIRFDSDREVDHLLDALFTIKEGEPFKASAVSELSRNLSSTKYFRSVEVLPLVDQAGPDLAIPMLVKLRAKANNQVELGLGASSDEGPRASVSWTKPFLNEHGHSFTTALKVSGPRQEATFEYRIPRRDPLNQFYTLQGGLQRLNLQDTQSTKYTVAAHRWDKRSQDWSRDLFVRVEKEDYRQADQHDQSFLVIPGVSYSRTRFKGAPEVSWGDSRAITLEVSDQAIGSDARFVRLWGRTKWLRTLGKDGRVIARAEQGAVWVKDVDQLPPSLRFFTGGDQTVRGFDYKSIAPRNSDGELVGAKYSTALSLEYDHRIAEKWRLATFVDTGTAANSYQGGFREWKVGTGFGVRWMTPIGPIRLDLAFGVSETHVPWRLHFTMGPEF